jgi:hypothetical protein
MVPSACLYGFEVMMAVLSCLLGEFVSEVVRGVWENVRDRVSISLVPVLAAWHSQSLLLKQGRTREW